MIRLQGFKVSQADQSREETPKEGSNPVHRNEAAHHLR